MVVLLLLLLCAASDTGGGGGGAGGGGGGARGGTGIPMELTKTFRPLVSGPAYSRTCVYMSRVKVGKSEREETEGGMQYGDLE